MKIHHCDEHSPLHYNCSILVENYPCDENPLLWLEFIILMKFITLMKIYHCNENFLMKIQHCNEIIIMIKAHHLMKIHHFYETLILWCKTVAIYFFFKNLIKIIKWKMFYIVMKKSSSCWASVSVKKMNGLFVINIYYLR